MRTVSLMYDARVTFTKDHFYPQNNASSVASVFGVTTCTFQSLTMISDTNTAPLPSAEASVFHGCFGGLICLLHGIYH